MGNSNDKDNFVSNVKEKAYAFIKDKKIIEKNILSQEITKRKKIDKDRTEQTLDLNIFIYSNDEINKYLYNSLKNDNTKVYNWKIKDPLIGFSKDKTKSVCDICKSDFKKKEFKNIVVIPIKSMNNFNNIIEEEGKDILNDFEELKEETQPFFLIIDEDVNDFTKKEEIISGYIPKEGKKELDYSKFSDLINSNLIEYKRLEKDFELKIDFEICEIDKLNKFKKFVLNSKNLNADIELFIDNKLFYHKLYGIENIDINNNDFFNNIIEKDIKSNKILHISLIFYNINTMIYFDYEGFGIKEVKLISYTFKKYELNNILRNQKYKYLDKRNFTVIREKCSPKINLLKYTGYFNQLGDLLFFNQIPLYSAKINIAVGGYIGSGKSTLINTILREKRCLEGRGSSLTNYISQYSVKDYPINFIDFPGFRAKRKGKENSELFSEEIENKISDLKQINEEIHCFLFCIKYEQRLSDENDDDMIEVFNSILRLKIRTFIVITNSEKEDTREFKEFKEFIMDNLEKIKEIKNNDKIFNRIFGEDLNKSIIPIFSKDKISHKNEIKAFGLDDLFKIIYEYFKDKKINLQKKIYFDDEKLKEFMNNNELLKIFESKKNLGKIFKEKIELEIEKFMLKIFLKAPKYIYSFSESNFYEIMNQIMELVLNLAKCYLNHKNSVEKYQILNNFPFQEFKEKYFSKEGIKSLENDAKESVKKFNSSIPWYVKTFFPILSPLYYSVGTILVKFFSDKIINLLLGDKLKLDDLIFDIYFGKLIKDLNKGIDGLKNISEYFSKIYELENKKEEIKDNDNQEFQKKIMEYLNKESNNINEIKAVSDFIDDNQYYHYEDDENNLKAYIDGNFQNYIDEKNE